MNTQHESNNYPRLISKQARHFHDKRTRILFQLFCNTFLAFIMLQTSACNNAMDLGSSDETETITTSEIVSSELFPADLSITSPTDSLAVSASLSANQSVGFAASRSTSSTSSTDEIIAQLLSATDIADCATEITIPTNTSVANPSCFGPTIDYENHPDIGDENSGELPSGDLGLWTEEETSTGDACSAAELNYRLDLVQARVELAQLSLASMVCVLNNSSTVSLATSESTTDLTTEVANALDSSTVSVTSATLSLDDSTGLKNYSYDLSLDVTDSLGTTTHSLQIHMNHNHLDSDGESFEGLLNYQYNDTATAGNCVGDTTQAGSVKYTKDSSGEYAVRSDSAEFCMLDDSPFTEDNVLDPTYKYDGVSDGGWGNNYNVFIANYSPVTMAGNYTHSWQAGFNDGQSRVINVRLDQDPLKVTGDAYFGYGHDVGDEDFDGSIAGFICDWATGVSTHTLIEKTQHQALSFDGSGFLATESHITYAPTSSCDYTPSDDTDGHLFRYDLDGDGSISEDEELSLSTDGVTNDLTDLSEMDFELPVAP